MINYKNFFWLIIILVCLLVIYLTSLLGYKKYQQYKIQLFYSDEKHIAMQYLSKNRPLSKVKPISKNLPIRILVLEGGGIYGVMSLNLLNYIEINSGKPTSELFDVICGTSVGALQAIFLTIPDRNNKPKYSAQDLINIINTQSTTILNINFIKLFLTGFGLISPIIDEYNYIAALQKYLGNAKLSDLTNTVLLTGYNIPKQEVIFFSSRADTNIAVQDDFLVYQLLSGITSIPGVMPPQEVSAISSKEVYLLSDPAIVLNNPIVECLIYANKLYPQNKKILVFPGLGLSNGENTKISSDYYHGLHGLPTNYAEMVWSPDKLFLSLMNNISNLNTLGLSPNNLFYIDEHLSTRIGGPLDASSNNLKILENLSNNIIKKDQPQLSCLIKRLLFESASSNCL